MAKFGTKSDRRDSIRMWNVSIAHDLKMARFSRERAETYEVGSTAWNECYTEFKLWKRELKKDRIRLTRATTRYLKLYALDPSTQLASTTGIDTEAKYYLCHEENRLQAIR